MFSELSEPADKLMSEERATFCDSVIVVAHSAELIICSEKLENSITTETPTVLQNITEDLQNG